MLPCFVFQSPKGLTSIAVETLNGYGRWSMASARGSGIFGGNVPHGRDFLLGRCSSIQENMRSIYSTPHIASAFVKSGTPHISHVKKPSGGSIGADCTVKQPSRKKLSTFFHGRRYLPRFAATRQLKSFQLSESLDACMYTRRAFASNVGTEPTGDQIEYDVVIVGGGPAGLSAAIRLKQLSKSRGEDISVCLVEKGADAGAHILSGCVLEPTALNTLFPNWRRMEDPPPIKVPVTSDQMFYLTKNRSFPIPKLFLPRALDNDGNYIISLGVLCKWMAKQAEALGVEVYPGISAAAPVYSSSGSLAGVRTSDVGIDKTGTRKPSFEPGMTLLGKQVLLAEGCRGSITEKLISSFKLLKPSRPDELKPCPRAYALGLKEIWEVDESKHRPGFVSHSVGWPLDYRTYGGSFVYHMDNNRVLMGIVIGLDYRNPFLNPYEELQRLKLHPRISSLLRNGRCIGYGARCLNSAGPQSVPRLTFPGGMLLGCAAGLLNVAKIKGVHLAMGSGIIAAEAVADALQKTRQTDNSESLHISEYEDRLKASHYWTELHQTRNVKPAFKLGGLFAGLAHSGMSLLVTNGREPWTLRWDKRDCEKTDLCANQKPIEYPKHDGILT
eukprot:GHVT01064785.1.p1 GENE.GHVT01064785.1~~GHVT01064785.1.p1  ORF type:complete len:613 (+),score=29.43 GHVT01064785.1:105-1943(+)